MISIDLAVIAVMGYVVGSIRGPPPVPINPAQEPLANVKSYHVPE